MKKVAKLVLVDQNNQHLLMYRGNHPHFGNDPDLPGGTHEDGESLFETMIREVREEIGVEIDGSTVKELYSGTDYSTHGTQYALFTAHVSARPEIVMSWEHSSYEWLDRTEFIHKAQGANDTFMHMVADILEKPAQS